MRRKKLPPSRRPAPKAPPLPPGLPPVVAPDPSKFAAALAAHRRAGERGRLRGMLDRLNEPPPHPGVVAAEELTMPELRRLVARLIGADPSGPLEFPPAPATLEIVRTEADMLDADRWGVALVLRGPEGGEDG